MEISNEEKARIFGAYLGCQIDFKIIDESVNKHGKMFSDGIVQLTPLILSILIANDKHFSGKLILTPLSQITKEQLIELAIVIGNTPHLIDETCEELKNVFTTYLDDALELMIDGTGLFFDLFTFNAMIDKGRELGIDLGYGSIPSLIEAGIAISSETLKTK